ncbi:hypothetical protein O3P69_000496 [Scylla paramamosain]|uniref:Uncharacterized protein n=1 Tax=Scylla paramamosain TaxID=85552 RepID=A0AAW0UUU6_SCYPA
MREANGRKIKEQGKRDPLDSRDTLPTPAAARVTPPPSAYKSAERLLCGKPSPPPPPCQLTPLDVSMAVVRQERTQAK